jgi:hypothetical protein
MGQHLAPVSDHKMQFEAIKVAHRTLTPPSQAGKSLMMANTPRNNSD